MLFRLQVKSRRDDRVYWTCAVRECPSRATTREGILIGNSGHHTHEGNPLEVVSNTVMQKIRKRCREETTPVPAIYKEELTALRTRDWNQDTASLVVNLPTYEGCKAQLYRQRSKTRPPLPKNRQDIRLDGEWTQTSTGQRFLLIDEGDDQRFLVFATDSNLQNLCAARTVYGDGTFYTCPDQFYQLYTWHTFVDGHMYPVMFALLPGKSVEVYRRLFEALVRECAQIDLILQPDVLFMDHEIAPRNAARHVFPRTDVKACFFHFAQCIWRKVQSCGLTEAYRTDENVHRLVRRAAVLPLVPIEAVEDVWFNALTDVGDLDLPAAVETFTDYVTNSCYIFYGY
jgi:hypothetical protein